MLFQRNIKKEYNVDYSIKALLTILAILK